jgi:hypothetical protein
VFSVLRTVLRNGDGYGRYLCNAGIFLLHAIRRVLDVLSVLAIIAEVDSVGLKKKKEEKNTGLFASECIRTMLVSPLLQFRC